jgi:hypothetical protein
MQAIVGGLVAFAVVVGWVLLRWRATGRDPTYLDDSSILLPAPPEGMTAATATIVDGGHAATAFMAALFDLASRDEIVFRDETPGARGAHHVGIELRGGDTEDARVLLNRRRPVGEGEAWLLANLKTYAVMRTGAADADERGMAAIAAMSQFSGFIANALAAGPESPTGLVVGTPRDPLSATGAPDLPTALIAAFERSGRPVPEALRSEAASKGPMLGLMREAMQSPAAVLADPEAFAKHVEAVTGYAPTPEEMDSALHWLRGQAPVDEQPGAAPSAGGTGGTVGTGGGSPTYIGAQRATMFHAPIGFATFVENYARRKGWLKGLSFIARWKWEGLAAIEVVAGLVVAATDGTGQQLVYGIGAGIAAGGAVTWLLARFMASRTQEGAVMKAQLAAYRRTLKATFDSSATLDDVAKAARMSWLETPDQTLVWGVALGLRSELEALLRRTTSGIDAGTVSRSAFLPGWVDRAAKAVSAVATEMASVAASPAAAPTASPPAPATDVAPDFAAVFAGIERIGTVAPPTTHH